MSLVPPPHQFEIAVLDEGDRDPLYRFLDQERLGSLYLRSLVHEHGIAPTPHAEHGRFLGGRRGRDLTAVVFAGNSRNLTTLGEIADLRPLLEHAFLEPHVPRLFVGPAEHARLVREAFARHGALPFLDREQLYYVLTPDSLVRGEPVDIRPALEAETESVAHAQAAMTEEDLGIPRSQIDFVRLREISRRRILEGKVWVVCEGPELVFKTEESARAEDGILIGGVYTHPQYRGRGFAARGIATWAGILFDLGLDFFALHVNRDNRPAVAAYERVGFRRHSKLRLMLTY